MDIGRIYQCIGDGYRECLETFHNIDQELLNKNDHLFNIISYRFKYSYFSQDEVIWIVRLIRLDIKEKELPEHLKRRISFGFMLDFEGWEAMYRCVEENIDEHINKTANKLLKINTLACDYIEE